MQLKNVAAVMVTAQLPPFAQPGQTIDVNVSSLGNAKSLRGGTLIATPLKGADGQIYALAQGNLIVGGAGAAAGGSKVQINHLSAGRIPDGATVERAVPTPLLDGETLQLDLNASDFATARAVAEAINAAKGDGTAAALDGRMVQVRVPAGDRRARGLPGRHREPAASTLAQPAARVVLNARTGSVVMNEAVTLGACAVAHGSLSVTDQLHAGGQPADAAVQGQTVQAEKSDIAITQQGGGAGAAARRRQAGRRGEGAERAGRHAAGPAGHPAGHEERRRAERRDRGDLTWPRSPQPRPQRAGLAIDTRVAGRAAGRSAASDPKAAVREAAKQFESLFMHELMKSMRAVDAGHRACWTTPARKLGTEMLDSQFASQLTRPARAACPRPSRASSSARWALAPGPIPAPASANNTPAPLVGARRQADAHPADRRRRLRAAAQRRGAARPRPRTGIPATFMVAQAALRPAGAARRSATPTARRRYNLFGIKAGADWKGPVAEVTTTEYVDGQPQKVVAKFRAYGSYAESFADYARLMKDSPRYAAAWWPAAGATPQRPSRRACSAPATPPTRPTPTS